MKLIGFYKNGNYTVKLLSDGSKIRETEEDKFIPSFAENCDVKITDCCDGGCQFCYEGCSPQGRHGNILNQKFFDTLHPYTELAINGNDLSHPDLIPFLEKLRDKKIITNMTVNQVHFEKHYDFIKQLINDKLIYGLGVSLRKPTENFINIIKTIDNVVIHVINGILSESDVEILKNNNLKLLILGYKHLRRGNDYYDYHETDIIQKQTFLYNELKDMINEFDVISFDNLAIKQLNVRRLMTNEEWNEFYMGDDGTMTFYIDLVDEKFGRNSLATVRYDLLDSIDDMFNVIKNEQLSK